MRWFLTAEQSLIPERSIVKITPMPDGGSLAYVLDQRGVMGTVQLKKGFDELTVGLDESDESEKPPARRVS